jgi:hypothetical protein
MAPEGTVADRPQSEMTAGTDTQRSPGKEKWWPERESWPKIGLYRYVVGRPTVQNSLSGRDFEAPWIEAQVRGSRRSAVPSRSIRPSGRGAERRS